MKPEQIIEAIEMVHTRDVDVHGRKVYLTNEVTWDSAIQALQSIQMLDSVGGGDIHLYITTEGGDSAPGMALFTGIRTCINDVIGHAWGECSSIGPIILQACKYRKMSAECFMMIHPGRLTMKNKHAVDFINYADNAKRDLEATWKIFYDRMKVTKPDIAITYDKFKETTTYDRYFTAAEALEHGLIDEIE